MAKTQTDFALWREAMGFNGKQVAEAGSLLGYSEASASLLHRGKQELTLPDRLAMAALRAGLKPWTPRTDSHAESVAHILRLVREMTEPPSRHTPVVEN